MGLPRAHRLKRPDEFQVLYKKGRKYVHRLAVFFALPSSDAGPRIGVTVSRRLGSAVRRNRIKRRLREAWRRRLHELPALDLVVVARAGLGTASFPQVLEAVDRFVSWLKVPRC